MSDFDIDAAQQLCDYNHWSKSQSTEALQLLSDALAEIRRLRAQLCDHDSHYMEEDDGHSHWRCLRCGSVTECESCAGEPS